MILWQHQRDLSMSDKWEGPESRGMEEEEKEESIDQGEYQEESRDQGEYQEESRDQGEYEKNAAQSGDQEENTQAKWYIFNNIFLIIYF